MCPNLLGPMATTAVNLRRTGRADPGKSSPFSIRRASFYCDEALRGFFTRYHA